jgi:hypothetical protein
MRRGDFDAAIAKHARRVFTLAVYLLGDREEAEDVTASFNAAVSRLETSGWKRILSVEEDDEQVYIFAREIEGAIAGLTVLVNDSAEEIVVVNIVGTIDPRLLGRLIANMDEMPDLEGLLGVVK